MYNTTYHRAGSVEEAAKLASANDEAKFVSGGQTLIPAMKSRLAAPSDLIDLRHIASMKGITISGKSVTIGAATIHYDVAASKELAAVCHALCSLASHIGDPHVRHMGTIGGSISNNDPAADYPSAMLALGATIVTNQRELSAEDFFTGLFETALEAGEIVTAVKFTAPDKAGYAKFPNPASRYAMTGVFVAKTGSDVKVAVTGAGENGVFRASAIEAALNANFSPDAVDGVSVSADGLMADMHASADYRANLIKVMAKRAVAAAGGGGLAAAVDTVRREVSEAAATLGKEASDVGAAVRNAVNEAAGEVRQTADRVLAAVPEKKRGWLARLFGLGK